MRDNSEGQIYLVVCISNRRHHLSSTLVVPPCHTPILHLIITMQLRVPIDTVSECVLTPSYQRYRAISPRNTKQKLTLRTRAGILPSLVIATSLLHSLLLSTLSFFESNRVYIVLSNCMLTLFLLIMINNSNLD